MKKILENGKVIFDDISGSKALLNGIPFEKIHVDVDKEKIPFQVLKKYENNFNIKDYSDEELEKRKKRFFMPEEYEKIDLKKYFIKFANTEKEKERIMKELKMIEKTNSERFFQYLIYLSDIIKAYDIVIGVGRGSSVSLYILYLLGLHRVNSLKYNLDPNEFFKF